MRLSEITQKDIFHVMQICSEGISGIELSVGLKDGMTQKEFTQAEEIIDIFLLDLKLIVKKNGEK
jgi:hypothetical protein